MQSPSKFLGHGDSRLTFPQTLSTPEVPEICTPKQITSTSSQSLHFHNMHHKGTLEHLRSATLLCSALRNRLVHFSVTLLPVCVNPRRSDCPKQ